MISKKLLSLFEAFVSLYICKELLRMFLKLLSFVVLNQKSTHRISRQVSCQGPHLRDHL